MPRRPARLSKQGQALGAVLAEKLKKACCNSVRASGHLCDRLGIVSKQRIDLNAWDPGVGLSVALLSRMSLDPRALLQWAEPLAGDPS